jgi:hypothetical protein
LGSVSSIKSYLFQFLCIPEKIHWMFEALTWDVTICRVRGISAIL